MVLKHLKLYCANLSEQRHFYTRKFRFELVRSSEESITLKIGDSLLTFIENKLQNSYYHFAFNIPFGEVADALRWIKKKVDILQFRNEEIQEYPSWKARAIYFLDPAGNVVEFIGRERVSAVAKPEESGNTFSERNVLHISEAGLPVFQVSSAVALIQKETGIPEFDCKDSTFCAIGDDRGLFIVVDKAEKTWFPSDEQARAFPLEVDFMQKKRTFRLKLQPGDHLEVVEL